MLECNKDTAEAVKAYSDAEYHEEQGLGYCEGIPYLKGLIDIYEGKKSEACKEFTKAKDMDFDEAEEALKKYCGK